MIGIEDFLALVSEHILDGRTPNEAQLSGLKHSGDEALLLVAGPGSGKTTVLVLRALRHVFVDGVLPEHILITTFTRKASKELRTRWLDWGSQLLVALELRPGLKDEIEKIDLNRCRIDTLDSISEQALSEHKLPGEIAPILVDDSASKLILKRQAFSAIYWDNKVALDALLSRYTFDETAPSNQGEALAVVKQICDRLIQDCVDVRAYSQASTTNALMVDIFTRYQTYLRENNVYDFALLEKRFLERLQDRTLQEWLSEIRVMLVDEYQDTNPLQESIYFQIITAVSPLVTVVGDDDQSMYRFRGGSVELFTNFGDRCRSFVKKDSRRIDMVENYRSSDEIVKYYNQFIAGDSEFQQARISPTKPEVTASKGALNFPVLGMFRNSPEELATDLSDWLGTLFTDRSASIQDGEQEFNITLKDNNDLGDAVFIAHTVEESKFNGWGQTKTTDTKFTGILRDEMKSRGMNIFNPRGWPLRSIQNVQRLLGLILLSLDPCEQRTEATQPTNEARHYLDQWRTQAIAFIADNPAPTDSNGLKGFVDSWIAASEGNPSKEFRDDWPVLELIFKLISWFPKFQNDPEHQVWLEAITRTISSAGMASPYGMQIYKDAPHRDRSRESIIRDALIPLAENEVGIDEDIMPSVPRSYLQLMTIHQAKGLEFPLVIVDVGSHFKKNIWKQAFRRFPRGPSNVVNMEDDIEAFLPAPLRTYRSSKNRTFDDLVRLYYVAYSRPQSVLLLVGCVQGLNYGKEGSLTDRAIPNVALGWARNGDWFWRQSYSGKKRPIQVETPLVRI